MAYLGDPREDRIDIYTGNNAGIGAGVIWESGGQKEQRFMWNGAWYDMCNLGAQEDGSVDTDQWKVLYHVVIENGTTPSGKTKVTITPSYKWENGKLSLSATASKAVEESITLTFEVNGANQMLVMGKGSSSAKVENLDYPEEPTVSVKVSADKKESENQIFVVNNINVAQKAYLKYGWVAFDDASEITDEMLLNGPGITTKEVTVSTPVEFMSPAPLKTVTNKNYFAWALSTSGCRIESVKTKEGGSEQSFVKHRDSVVFDGKTWEVLVEQDFTEGKYAECAPSQTISELAKVDFIITFIK